MEQTNTDRTLKVMVQMGREAKQYYDRLRAAIRGGHMLSADSAYADVMTRLATLSMLAVRLGLVAHQQAFLDLL